MQAFNAWEPPGGTLGRILEATRERISSLNRASSTARVGSATAAAPVTARIPSLARPSLKQALRRTTVTVIAELKRRSPSKGLLNETLDVAGQARAFERGGAAAVSVLTEPVYFGGEPDDMETVARAVALPLLKKDFHIHLLQLQQAVELEASAALLIARALPPEELKALMSAARALDLETVVEVRTEQELGTAIEAGAEIIGVNSRNLETLEMDERVPRRLMPRIPPEVIGVWESGIQVLDDVRRAADCGADAILVGSALSQVSDPESLVRSFGSIPRKPRRG